MPVPPTAGAHPIPVLSEASRTYVFTAQLRTLGNPNEQPVSRAWGVFQLMLVQSFSDPEQFVASWWGRVFNPGGETFADAVIAQTR